MINNSLKIGCSTKYATVIGFSIRPFIKTTRSGEKITSNKIFIKTRSSDGSEYTINEVWKKDYDETFITQGLWLDLDTNGLLRAESDLARLLLSVGTDSVESLIGRELEIKPKSNGFMCIILDK